LRFASGGAQRGGRRMSLEAAGADVCPELRSIAHYHFKCIACAIVSCAQAAAGPHSDSVPKTSERKVGIRYVLNHTKKIAPVVHL
jgi:hypothetical protein